jgi:hypothetical protein
MKNFWATMIFINVAFGLYNIFCGLVVYNALGLGQAKFFIFAALFHMIGYHFCSLSHEKEALKEKDNHDDEM